MNPMPYTVTPTYIPELLILEPKVLGDARGYSFIKMFLIVDK